MASEQSNSPTANYGGLSKFLHDNNFFDVNDVARAQQLASQNDTSLVKALLDLGLMEEEQLLSNVAQFYGIDFLRDGELPLSDPEVLAALGPGFLEAQQVWVGRSQDGQVQAVISDPEQSRLQQEIEFLLEEPVRIAIASRSSQRVQFSKTVQPEEIKRISSGENELSEADYRLGSASQRDGPVMRFVNDCISRAIEENASDIHFTSTSSGLSLRYRIHGHLSPQTIPAGLPPKAIFARLKVLSDMNVTERRRPQDGRFSQSVGGRQIHFRVSSLPTAYGESVVVRPLDPNSLRLGWEHLGFDVETLEGVKSILGQPNGLFLVTGPTGSGKSTTLYTALNSLNNGQRKIITVEDPVEYQLDGIDQVQVNPDIGLTFASALRSVLRQDPNVIMVGEIRDRETAEIACRAALVGRLVLSTLHTNSAQGAITRLTDLGVEPFIVKDVLRGVLSQELNPVPCGSCRGAGCLECQGAGVTSRKLSADLLYL